MNYSNATMNVATADSEDESVKLIRVKNGVAANNTRKKHSIQEVVTPPTAAKKQKVISKGTNVTSSIDLTGDVVVANPYFVIKNQNALFYSYDPRGDKSLGDSVLLCNDCNCPVIYCSDSTIGQLAAKRTLVQIQEEDVQEYDDQQDIITEFNDIYTQLIKNKMIWNNIPFKPVQMQLQLCLPECVVQGSLKMLCEDVKQIREKEADHEWLGLDIGSDDEEYELSPSATMSTRKMIAKAQAEKVMRTGPVVIKIPTLLNTGPSPGVKQTSDVSPLFKAIKMKVKEWNNKE